MGAVIKGTGVVFSTGAIGGILTHIEQSADAARSAEKTVVKDNGGAARAVAYHGFMKTLTLSIIPQGATVALAQAAMDTGMYGPGTSLIITDDIGTVVDGTYNVDSSRQRRTVDGVAVLDLELSKGDEGNDITTLVS